MIDIIIPAYNSHKTIKQTLLSICMQNISPLIDVYIIDDCSEKPYDYLKDLFKDKIDLTIIRNEENKGTGVSRNIGLEASKNPYIFFLDSDDLLPSMYSMGNLFNTIEKEQSDLVVGVMCIQEENLRMTYIKNNKNCAASKLYSRNFIEKHNLRFPASSNHEDGIFNNLLLVARPKISYIDNETYFYRLNENSTTRKDPKYLYNSLKELAKNNIWFAVEAEKRNFNKSDIAAYLFQNICYSYFIILDYLDEPDIQTVYRNLVLFLSLYMSYDKFLLDEDKYRIYCGYIGVYKHIPPISFYEFLGRISNSFNK
jgi:glycosyltransferase involved in cell wall biosynthesis